MKRSVQPPPEPWRIAAVWFYEPMHAQHTLAGLVHRAGLIPTISIRKFDSNAAAFERDVLQPLAEWQPHGVIVHMADWDRLKTLRKRFPKVPFVSALNVPPDLADTRVVASGEDIFGKAMDYYHGLGVSQVVRFCLTTVLDEARHAAFRNAFPGVSEVLCPLEVARGATPALRRRRDRLLSEGLRALPKPAGMVVTQPEAAPFLLEWCEKLGFRVPQDIQIIGTDEEDRCLECEPHLTSITLPRERIGAAALDAILSHVRGDEPPPPAMVRVPGATIIPRDSTAALSAGHSAVAGVLDLMRDRAAKGITATGVARLSRVGRTMLYKQFTAATGESPGHHLRRLRLAEACRRLRETDDTVTAIARASGFASLISFARFFRREMGVTPTAYRQTARCGNDRERERVRK
jgi:AraC-like DNA-binding protein